MKLEEVIRILYRWRNGDYQIYDDVLKEAIQLGIEALKNYKKMKDMGEISRTFMLPGETEE